MLAQREFTKDEYADWERRYHDAETAEEGRDKLKEDLHAEVEINLRLIGATAIEDKLQDGVPETIQMIKVRSVCPFRQLFASSLTLRGTIPNNALQDGGIKLWVLTGDKKQTAINIGYSCKLLNRTTMKPPLIIEPIGDSTNKFAAIRKSLEAQNRQVCPFASWWSIDWRI